ncbi:MAG: thioredoxin family protein [Bacteroidales bacterium]|nr:thioredoxin family protein [Bacteroidales bacterium]
MKRILFVLLISMFALPSLGQVVNPVEWEYKVQKEEDNTALLIFKADIEQDWHLYSQNFPEGGPIRTSFNFDESPHFKLMGETGESPEPVSEFDESFGVQVKYFSGEATFKQKIKLQSQQPFDVTGNIEYQVCQEEKCVYFNPDFTFNVPGSEQASQQREEQPVQETAGTETGSEQAEAESSGTAQKDMAVPSDEAEKADRDSPKLNEETPSQPAESVGSSQDLAKNKSLLGFFLLSVVFGLAGILTPCVFPMIPMTVSFFMQESKSRFNGVIKALIFGISIIILYTSVGIIVSLTSAGADFTSVLGTHWIPNLIFFLLFLTFAASFFGLFEIVLPSGLANKADKQVDKGGFLASFFMALTLVIVSFSCTGPIVGALLVKAVGGSVVEPTIGMFGFALGFGLPFTVLAIFPGWLKNLPKSGGWMNAVKVVLAFIILAFAFKFLANIDQNYHLGILSRDLYISIWIAIFGLLGFYLLGKIKLPNDNNLKNISVFRLLLAIASFSFAIYLVPGLFGANLSSISGLLPPRSAQKFDITSVTTAPGSSGDASNTMCEDPKYADFLNLPYNVKGYFKYEQGMECAEDLNKPVLVYFTGHSCSNCKKMQAEVWSEPAVQRRLNQDYVLIALYIDDREKLPESEWMESDYDGKVKKTLGKKNMAIEIDRFGVNTQPYYRILTPEGKPVGDSFGYTTKPQEFIDWLDQGMMKFNGNQ